MDCVADRRVPLAQGVDGRDNLSIQIINRSGSASQWIDRGYDLRSRIADRGGTRVVGINGGDGAVGRIIQQSRDSAESRRLELRERMDELNQQNVTRADVDAALADFRQRLE